MEFLSDKPANMDSKFGKNIFFKNINLKFNKNFKNFKSVLNAATNAQLR